MFHLSMTLLTSMLAGPAVSAPSPEAAVRQLAQAADVRDAATTEKLLHTQYRVTFAVRGKPGVNTIDRAGYLGMMKAGKLGGVPRTVDIAWQNSDGQFAQVRGQMKGAHATFETMWTLVLADGRWQVVSESTRMTVAK